MRQRTVYSSLDVVVDAWLRGVPGRNGKGSIRTDGVTIWSYGEHFPMASKVAGSSSAVWWNCDTYSPTTNRHQSDVMRRLGPLALILPVPTEFLKQVIGRGYDLRALHDRLTGQSLGNISFREGDMPNAISTIKGALKEAGMRKRLAEFEGMLKDLETKRMLIKLAE